MTKLFATAMLATLAASAHAGDVSYTFSGGTLTSVYEQGAFADGTIAPKFVKPAGFTLDTSTLSGSITGGIGTFSEHYALGVNQGPYLDLGDASATEMVDFRGSSAVITSIVAGIPAHYPSGDLKGVIFGYSYVSNALGSVLTVVENYLPYLGQDSGTARETFSNVTLSVANPMQAPEIDPASAISAATLLLGALTVLRSRKRL